MNEDLITFIEPELEVRIVALVLGEASAFEREELERIIAERPEARLFKNRMEELHGFVDEASNPVSAIAWKLSSERRDRVLSKISEEQPVVASPPRKKPTNQFRRRLIFYGAAACFVAIVAGLATPAILKSEKSSVLSLQTMNFPEGMDHQEGLRLKEGIPQPRGLLVDRASDESADNAHGSFKPSGNGREEGRQAGASAGDLLASIDGDYSLEVPVVDSREKSESRRLSNFRQNARPQQGAKEDRKSTTYAYSVNGNVNTRDGGLEHNLSAALDEYVVSGNEGDKERVVKMGEPASEPEPVTATAALGIPEEAGAVDPTGFTGVADMEGFVDLSDFEAVTLEAQPQANALDFGWAGKLAEGAELESLSLARESVEKKPAAPSSSMAKAMASNTASPAAVPVPQPKMDGEFGNGDDFGDGWGIERATLASESKKRSAGLFGEGKDSLFEDKVPEVSVPRGVGLEPSSQRNRGERDERIAQEQEGDSDPFGGGGGDADPFAGRSDEALVKRESVRHQAADLESEEHSPRSIVVQTKFVDVKQENVEELGFDWAETRPGDSSNLKRGSRIVPKQPESNGRGSERMAGEQDLDLDGITLSEEESDQLQKLGDIVQEKRKELTVQIQQQGVPYFDGRSFRPVGATEEETYRHAQKSLDDFESDREVLAQELQKVREEKAQNSDQIEDALKSRLTLLDRQVGKMREVVDNKQDVTVELSLKQNHYNQTKEDYEVARDEYRELKTELAAKGAPARETLRTKRALLAEIDAAIPSDDSIVGSADDDPFSGGNDAAAGGIKPRLGIVDILKNSGVSFPPGASATILPGSNTSIVRSTPTNLELIDGIVKAAGVETEKTEEIKKQKQIELDTFETSTSQKSDSTFSLNVSDVSFKLAKSALANGQWPEAEKVRPEEFVNALSYGDDTPTQAEKVACVIEQGRHPFMQQRNLMRVAMSTAALGRNASTPLRLTVLLDQSGSMERADRAESVRRAFALLTSQLNANDEITLVGFARTPRLLAERVKGNESGKLTQIVASPLTEGGTNLEAALSSGLQLAKQQFVEGAQNRIILLTDGAANLGDALPENLAKQVSNMRDAGIAFDACGVGADGLNDEVLTSLAKQGDGRYYFLDRPEDADEGFARQIAGALRPAAKNVKVQVIFNPERVSTFKLYGFEKHQLKKEDFRNDSVDAAEMAAEESGVALYHFQPLPEGRGDIGTVSVRFLDTATNQMVERTWTIPYQSDSTTFSEADPTLRLASVAGLFAERLKGSLVGERVELKRLRQEAELLKPVFRNQTRFQEFQTMLQQAGE